jgi:hypothetical protein
MPGASRIAPTPAPQEQAIFFGTGSGSAVCCVVRPIRLSGLCVYPGSTDRRASRFVPFPLAKSRPACPPSGLLYSHTSVRGQKASQPSSPCVRSRCLRVTRVLRLCWTPEPATLPPGCTVWPRAFAPGMSGAARTPVPPERDSRVPPTPVLAHCPAELG